MSDTSEEKALPPSEKKIKDARKKGQVPQHKEMVTAAVTVASFSYLMLRAPGLAVTEGTQLDRARCDSRPSERLRDRRHQQSPCRRNNHALRFTAGGDHCHSIPL